VAVVRIQNLSIRITLLTSGIFLSKQGIISDISLPSCGGKWMGQIIPLLLLGGWKFSPVSSGKKTM